MQRANSALFVAILFKGFKHVDLGVCGRSRNQSLEDTEG